MEMNNTINEIKNTLEESIAEYMRQKNRARSWNGGNHCDRKELKKKKKMRTDSETFGTTLNTATFKL